MKRDMNLIRQIVFKIEDAEDPINSEDIQIDGYTPKQIGHHCKLMANSGMIDAFSTETLQSSFPEYHISGLTALGHDFADAARNDTVWNKTMTGIKNTAGSVTVDVLITFLKQQATAMLGAYFK